MKLVKTRKTDNKVKALAPFASHPLPPCARSVRDGGQRTALYWRGLTILAEVWS